MATVCGTKAKRIGVPFPSNAARAATSIGLRQHPWACSNIRGLAPTSQAKIRPFHVRCRSNPYQQKDVNLTKDVN
jgi:hypothetical protein